MATNALTVRVERIMGLAGRCTIEYEGPHSTAAIVSFTEFGGKTATCSVDIGSKPMPILAAQIAGELKPQFEPAADESGGAP